MTWPGIVLLKNRMMNDGCGHQKSETAVGTTQALFPLLLGEGTSATYLFISA